MRAFSMSRRVAAGMAAGLVAAGAVASWMLAGSDDALDRVRARGELRIGYAVEPPYAQLAADGTPGGESPEVAREVARRLGVRPTWVLTGFDRLIPELESDRFDLVAAGLFITPERAQRVRFSRPTLRVRPGWLRRPDAPAPQGAYAEAAGRPGLRIAAVAGSVEAAYFAARLPAAQRLLLVPDAGAGRDEVAAGRSDALALSLPTVLRMAAESQAGLVAEPAGGADAPADLVGLAVRPDDASLARAVDAALADYLGSPEHLAMLRPLGLGAADLPGAPRDAR